MAAADQGGNRGQCGSGGGGEGGVNGGATAMARGGATSGAGDDHERCCCGGKGIQGDSDSVGMVGSSDGGDTDACAAASVFVEWCSDVDPVFSYGGGCSCPTSLSRCVRKEEETILPPVLRDQTTEPVTPSIACKTPSNVPMSRSVSVLMNGAAPVSVESHNVAAPTKRSSMQHCNSADQPLLTGFSKV